MEIETRFYSDEELVELFNPNSSLQGNIPKSNTFLHFLSINAFGIFNLMFESSVDADIRQRIKLFITNSPMEVIEKFVKNVKIADFCQHFFTSLSDLVNNNEMLITFFEVFNVFLRFNNCIFINALPDSEKVCSSIIENLENLYVSDFTYSLVARQSVHVTKFLEACHFFVHLCETFQDHPKRVALLHVAIITNQFNPTIFEGIVDDPDMIEKLFNLNEIQCYDILTIFLRNKLLTNKAFQVLLEQLPLLSLRLQRDNEVLRSNITFCSMTTLFAEIVSSIVSIEDSVPYCPKARSPQIRMNTTNSKLFMAEATPNFLMTSFTRSCPVFNFETSNIFPILEEDENQTNSLPPQSFVNEEIHDYDEIIVNTSEAILNHFLKCRFGDVFKSTLITLFSNITSTTAMKQILITSTDIIETVKSAINNPNMGHLRSCLLQIQQFLPKTRKNDSTDEEIKAIDDDDSANLGLIPHSGAPISTSYAALPTSFSPSAFHRHTVSLNHAAERVQFDPTVCFPIPE